MSEVEMDLLAPKALVFKSKATPLTCVDFFEAGEENVYLLNDQGMYLGTACQRQNFRLDWDGHLCKAHFAPMQPAIFHMPINEQNLPRLSEAVDISLAANPRAREVPVVQGGGQLWL